MAPKQRRVKFTTVLLPLLSFAVERRVKNTSAYLNRTYIRSKRPPCKQNVAQLSLLQTLRACCRQRGMSSLLLACEFRQLGGEDTPLSPHARKPVPRESPRST
jgi:hypothetical protein